MHSFPPLRTVAKTPLVSSRKRQMKMKCVSFHGQWRQDDTSDIEILINKDVFIAEPWKSVKLTAALDQLSIQEGVQYKSWYSTVGFAGPGLEMVSSSLRGGKRWPVPATVTMCVSEGEKRQEEGKSCLIWVDGSSRRVQTDCAAHLVNFPFPQAVSSPPLLVQVPEINEESWRGEETSVTWL